MQELTVVTVEDGSLVAAASDGAQYRVQIDDTRLAQLRRARTTGIVADKKVPPREIQAHIRAGMTAEDVATLTGADLAYVERFEGPVLAERDYVVQSALNVAVHTAGETDPLAGTSFGAVIRERLAGGGATQERWSSWKDPETGWIVKLTFVAETVEHDARWGFEPRTHALSPLNTEAVALSQQGAVPASLIPRLRAVEWDERSEQRHERPERSRFDSDAFTIEEGDLAGAAPAPARRAPAPMNQTADLLEALRRRRGERETRSLDDVEADLTPTAGIRLVEVPLPNPDAGVDAADTVGDTGEVPLEAFGGRPSHAGTGAKGARRNRAAMPSWDEIVFGARGDDDA
ncbi:MAG: DUF3071 domain-containing protein [Micrococcales bacterium]|nr:DUF3071 domain-containing protein [Micrococcales bacterium]